MSFKVINNVCTIPIRIEGLISLTMVNRSFVAAWSLAYNCLCPATTIHLVSIKYNLTCYLILNYE